MKCFSKRDDHSKHAQRFLQFHRRFEIMQVVNFCKENDATWFKEHRRTFEDISSQMLRK